MKGVFRDVLGTFVELSPEPAKEPAGPAQQPRDSEPPAPTPTAAPPAVASEPDDALIDSQVDAALGKVASQQLVEFLTLYDNMAFIPSATDRVRAVLVAKSLSVQAIHELFGPQLTAIGRIQSSFASTLGTKLAQADALAQAQIGEADAAIAAAREQIAALEGQIKSSEEEKARATAALEAAKLENATLQRRLERACDSRRSKLVGVQKVLADYERGPAG
jgi:hypothetical protein